MTVKFQADADLNEIIVKATLNLEPRIDFRTATTAKLMGVADPLVLAIAAKEQRLLITHDKTTMPKHFEDFILHTESSGVIVIIKPFNFSEVAQFLSLVWKASDAEEWINVFDYYP